MWYTLLSSVTINRKVTKIVMNPVEDKINNIMSENFEIKYGGRGGVVV